MNIEKHILLLRISYWIPALADFVISYLVLLPQEMGTTDIVLPMGLTSAIAFSWGVLLLFADRKPMERRWILIPTILVVSLLTAVRIIFCHKGLVEFGIGFMFFGICLSLFMTFSYYYANKKSM